MNLVHRPKTDSAHMQERLIAVMRRADIEASFATARAAAPDLRLRRVGALGLIVSSRRVPRGRRQRLRRLVVERRALEQLLASGPVMPARFDAAPVSQAALSAMAADHAEAFEARLAEHHSLAEYQIVVSWRPEEVLRSLTTKNETKAASSLQRPDAAALAAAAEARRSSLRREILGRLANGSHGALERPVARIEEVAAAAILMPRPAVGERPNGAAPHDATDRCFQDDRALDGLLEAVDGLWDGMLTVRCIGPMPPFSFATIVLETMAIDDLEAAKKRLDVAALDATTVRAARRRSLMEAVRSGASGEMITALRTAADQLMRVGVHRTAEHAERLHPRFVRGDTSETAAGGTTDEVDLHANMENGE